jgi:hypothetical protein
MKDLDAKEDLSYQRVSCQDFGNVRDGYAKQEDQDVQDAMESPYQGRSYLGKGRRVEGRVSKFLSLVL